jgi:integrase
MATKKRARGRAHPGVVLIPPKGRNGWQARYKDPDTDRFKWETLPATRTTAEARDDWAKRKSLDLAKRRDALAGGAPRATGTALADAVDRYFSAHPQLRERTVEGYRAAADKLVAWAAENGAKSADDLTRAKLVAFRAVLVAAPKRTTVTGGKRGARTDGDKPRSAERVNSELRKVGTVLTYLVDADLLPKLTRDDLRRALKKLPVTHERATYLNTADLAQLLQAARLHDAETYVETRDEHAREGRQRIGTTARYDAIAPFVAFVLLTGCRFGEALSLDWADVDLAARELHLRGAATKTHRARTVDLDVSPALHALLSRMRPADGQGSVFGLSRGTANAAAKRLHKDYGAPAGFTWQALRRTCGTYLTNAPGIFGAASAYRSARQLGHSVAVAERHYLGLVRGIPPTATTLESAMAIDSELQHRLTH